MDFQIYPDNLISLLFKTPLMMVDSIRVLIFRAQTGKDTQSKRYILETECQKETHNCFDFVRKKCVL